MEHIIRQDGDGQLLLGFAVVKGFGRKPKAEPLPPHQAGSATSRAAAERSAPRQAGRRARVLAFITGQGAHGSTRDELSAALDLPVHTLTSPVRALLDSGDIVETTRTRLTRLGSPAAVLVVSHLAKEGNG